MIDVNDLFGKEKIERKGWVPLRHVFGPKKLGAETLIFGINIEF
jgi:hypothetical protein